MNYRKLFEAIYMITRSILFISLVLSLVYLAVATYSFDRMEINQTINRDSPVQEITATNGECEKTVDTEKTIKYMCKPIVDIFGHKFEPLYMGKEVVWRFTGNTNIQIPQ